MIEKILENVINAMTPHLNLEQIEHLSNTLYVNFHGVEVKRANGTDQHWYRRR